MLNNVKPDPWSIETFWPTGNTLIRKNTSILIHSPDKPSTFKIEFTPKCRHTQMVFPGEDLHSKQVQILPLVKRKPDITGMDHAIKDQL